MNIVHKHKSPHFSPSPIPIQFLILHYTAQDLKHTLDIFLNEQSKVSSHLILDTDGTIYEVVPCLKEFSYKAFHAGISQWTTPDGQSWRHFNDFSIGLEIINLNGNIFPYTEAQYKSLFELITHLQNIYPELKKTERILGHEHIAGFRHKSDPGFFFDWDRLFQEVYQTQKPNYLKPVIDDKKQKKLSFIKQINNKQAKFISLFLEKNYPFWLKILIIKIWLFIDKKKKRDSSIKEGKSL